MRTTSALIAAFILSFILTPLFKVLGQRLKILDYPRADKIHAEPTPLLGGAAIFLSFLIIVILTTREINNAYSALFIAGTIIFVSGLVDDIKPLSPFKRLFIQFIAAIILITNGIYFTFLPNVLAGKIGEFALTLVWILGITNAFNYLDGLNGLASGVAMINAMFFFVFAGTTGQPIMAYLLIIFLGACAGFFPYNFRLFLFGKVLFRQKPWLRLFLQQVFLKKEPN